MIRFPALKIVMLNVRLRGHANFPSQSALPSALLSHSNNTFFSLFIHSDMEMGGRRRFEIVPKLIEKDLRNNSFTQGPLIDSGHFTVK